MSERICGVDCSRKEAAIAAAEAALEAAEELAAAIKEEQENINVLSKEYTSARGALIDAGRSIATETNTTGLNNSLQCLKEYSGNLSAAATACANEISKCKADLAAANAMACDPIEC